MGLKSPTKCYMVSRAVHQKLNEAVIASIAIMIQRLVSDCVGNMTSHTISAKDFYTSMGIPLAS